MPIGDYLKESKKKTERKKQDLSQLIGSRIIKKSADGLTRPEGEPDIPRRPPKKREEEKE